ncbi:MAG: histidine phosphatase family protein [Hymenobacter sp.]
MKTLYLMRHAKSSWSFDELNDQERPLNDRGRDDAPRMGQALAARHIKLDRLVSSPAVRAMSTAVLVARELAFPSADIVIEPTIYQADVDTLLAIIRAHARRGAVGAADRPQPHHYRRGQPAVALAPER